MSSRSRTTPRGPPTASPTLSAASLATSAITSATPPLLTSTLLAPRLAVLASCGSPHSALVSRSGHTARHSDSPSHVRVVPLSRHTLTRLVNVEHTGQPCIRHSVGRVHGPHECVVRTRHCRPSHIRGTNVLAALPLASCCRVPSRPCYTPWPAWIAIHDPTFRRGAQDHALFASLADAIANVANRGWLLQGSHRNGRHASPAQAGAYAQADATKLPRLLQYAPALDRSGDRPLLALY